VVLDKTPSVLDQAQQEIRVWLGTKGSPIESDNIDWRFLFNVGSGVFVQALETTIPLTEP
jgi:hypothetical protein